MKKESILGVDLECENNLHHYGVYISLIQISSRTRTWIVDVIGLGQIDPIIHILEDKDIEKIFHDTGFDLRVLHMQFQCRPRNIYDTELAARLLGYEEIGLGSLLERFFNIKKRSRFQMADWTKRPISEQMLRYAAKDTVYLIKLRNILSQKLRDKGRLKWARQEFEDIENKELTYQEGTYSDLRGFKQLTPRERAILKRLYFLREKLAKQVDRPTFFIISTKRLIELAKNPPGSVSEWRNIKGVHPILKRKAWQFNEEVQKGRKESIEMPLKKAKRLSHAQREHSRRLSEIRDRISVEMNIPRHMILSQDQIRDIVLTRTAGSLRSWQKELIEKHWKDFTKRP
jgi:ribonuclease D